MAILQSDLPKMSIKHDVGSLVLTGDGVLLLVVVPGEAPDVADVGLAVVVVLQPLPVPHQRLALGRSLHVVAGIGKHHTLMALMPCSWVSKEKIISRPTVAVHRLRRRHPRSRR